MAAHLKRRTVALGAAVAVAFSGVGAFTTPASASYPGANGRIAYVAYDGTGLDIYTVDADGTNRLRLTYDGRSTEPAWSPNGRQIAFTRAVNGQQDIHVMNADGSEVRRVTYAASNDTQATWSPDGQYLAFVSDRRPSPRFYLPYRDIYRVRASAPYGNTVRLTQATGTFCQDQYISPRWSPLGDRILLIYFQACGEQPLPQFGTIDAWNGGDYKTPPVDSRQYLGYLADWSPDGTRIAWEADSTYSCACIFITRVEGSRNKVVTRRGAAPVWSPNGRYLAYEARYTQNDGVWVVRATGENARLVALGGSLPSWQPKP